MARLQAKICGLSTPETIDAAIAGGAAWIGFVFFPGSPRDIAPDRVGELAARLPERIGRVGVFVDADDALIDRAVAAGVGTLQLHGRETPERAAALKRRHGIDVWKAAPIRTRADLADMARYRGAADRILYDAKPAPGSALPGGTGMRFDWTLLAGFDHPLPWILSGGLDAENLSEAVAVTGARAVDVSSGVESAPGFKQVDKIAAFLQAADRL